MTDPKRVLVCGGRDYNDRDHIHNTLCELRQTRAKLVLLIHKAGNSVFDGNRHRPVDQRIVQRVQRAIVDCA